MVRYILHRIVERDEVCRAVVDVSDGRKVWQDEGGSFGVGGRRRGSEQR